MRPVGTWIGGLHRRVGSRHEQAGTLARVSVCVRRPLGTRLAAINYGGGGGGLRHCFPRDIKQEGRRDILIRRLLWSVGPVRT
jgi:hypothetical protein